MGRTKKEIVVETIKCNLCSKELKGDDLVYYYGCQKFCGECFKGVLKTKGKINELQQRIDKALEINKQIKSFVFNEMVDRCVPGSTELYELVNEELKVLGGKND